jgi:hypothetical protein
LGALVFAVKNHLSPDTGVAALYFAGGLGLFAGMMIARRVGAYFEFKGRTIGFIGWSLLIQGIFFALMGVMPNIWLAGLMLFSLVCCWALSSLFRKHSLMRLVPDHLRGRVSTTDRASEMLVWSLSTFVGGWSLHAITPQTLTIFSGLLSGTAGIAWLILFGSQMVRLPKRLTVSVE